jgi:hypothetical protein
MKLTHLSNQRIIISRLYPVTGSNKLAMSTVTAALVHLQPVGVEKVQLVGGVPGKTYRIFADGDIDLKEDDQLKDETNNLYTVKKGGVTKWQHGAMDYQEVIIIRS